MSAMDVEMTTDRTATERTVVVDAVLNNKVMQIEKCDEVAEEKCEVVEERQCKVEEKEMCEELVEEVCKQVGTWLCVSALQMMEVMVICMETNI